MSSFKVQVVEIQKVGKHPNADTLSITTVDGGPCIFRTGDFEEGDTAIYVPIDSVVSLDHSAFKFLRKKEGRESKKTHRVRAARLRGIFSMGLLIPLSALGKDVEDVRVGDDVAARLGVIKYEEPKQPVSFGPSQAEKDPGFAPVYDMESYRKYKHLLQPGEAVSVTEKIHGVSSKFAYKDGRFWVASHHVFRKFHEDNLWWKAAKQYDLEAKTSMHTNLVFYGEIYGQVQDLKYNTQSGEIRFACFDIFDTTAGRFLDVADFKSVCTSVGLPMAPVLYEGPYIPEVVEPLADGKSTLGDNIREGFVIKPMVGRWNSETGRTMFKLVSESYLLRGNGTEHH